jgi:hypothetical protein
MTLFDQIDGINQHISSEQVKEASPEDVQATLRTLGVETSFTQNQQGCYIFARDREKEYLQQECSDELRKVLLQDYKHEKDQVQLTDLVCTTLGNYQRYGEQVLERIETSMLTILKALSDTIECYEPAEGSPDDTTFTIPVAAWDKFYQGHTQVEENLTRILQTITAS